MELQEEGHSWELRGEVWKLVEEHLLGQALVGAAYSFWKAVQEQKVHF